MKKTADIADELRPILEKHQVVLAYLFGSAARGEMGPHSDIDVAVLFPADLTKDEQRKRELDIYSDIASEFHLNEVDVINLVTTRNPLLKQNIIVEGLPIIVQDSVRRFAVERAIIQEYEDTRFLRRTAADIMREQLKDGTFGRFLIRPA